MVKYQGGKEREMVEYKGKRGRQLKSLSQVQRSLNRTQEKEDMSSNVCGADTATYTIIHTHTNVIEVEIKW